MDKGVNSILLVGPYTPRQCGIATHVIQLEQVLRAEGWVVDTLAPLDCAATYREDLSGLFNCLKLIKYAKKYKLVNIHFDFGEFFYVKHNPRRILNIFTLLALGVVFKMARNINVVMHEQSPARFFFQRTALQSWVWKQAARVTFFTKRERESFLNKYDLPCRTDQYVVEEVNKNFISYSNLSKKDARLRLKLSEQTKIILCIGFIQWNKGFERLAKIFSEGAYSNLQLYIVGSVRNGDESAREYYAKLSEMCEKVENIKLVNHYLSDEDFDIWINASDYIALPYLRISNSGVLGRARLLNMPAIVSDVGGLSDQVGPNDILFSSDEELKVIIDRIASTDRQGV